MKFFIAILIMALLIQTSFLPINLVLLLLIARSLVNPDRYNLYLAFFIGLALGVLTSVNVGFYALTFVLISQICLLLRKTPFTANYLTVLPIFFSVILLNHSLEGIFLGESVNFLILLVETACGLPIFFMTKFWESRFTVAPPIRLKI